MILEEETYEKFGYHPSKIAPKSRKRILAACDGCGEVRGMKKNGYHSLCRSCSQKRRYLSHKHPFLGKHHSEATRKKISNSEKGKKSHMFGKPRSETVKKKISKATKGKKSHMFGKHHSEATRKKLSEANAGEKSYLWKGGVSFEPYCERFNNKFKDYIRVKFGRVCFLCQKTEVENGQRLSVHHCNYDKECLCNDNPTCQFVPLCIGCNSKVNINRDMWEQKIKAKMQNKLNGWYI